MANPGHPSPEGDKIITIDVETISALCVQDLIAIAYATIKLVPKMVQNMSDEDESYVHAEIHVDRAIVNIKSALDVLDENDDSSVPKWSVQAVLDTPEENAAESLRDMIDSYGVQMKASSQSVESLKRQIQ